MYPSFPVKKAVTEYPRMLLNSTDQANGERFVYNTESNLWRFLISVEASLLRLWDCFGLGQYSAWELHQIEADLFILPATQCVKGIADQVVRARRAGILLAENQCRDLSSKLDTTIVNIQNLVFPFPKQMHYLFRSAFDELHKILEKARLLVNDCSKADWCRAAVFQIQNEEAFRELLLEVALCYNVIYNQAKWGQRANWVTYDHEVEDLRQTSTFSPASDDFVLKDQETLCTRLDTARQLAKNSGSSHDQILPGYLLGRLKGRMSTYQSRIEALQGMSDAILLQVPKSERIWDVSNDFIGRGSGADFVCKTKWLDIPCAKKIFYSLEPDVTFRKEAALLASLNHPNIVKFFCCGSEIEKSDDENVYEKTRCYIGMELMKVSLDDLIKGRRKEGRYFSRGEYLDIILQIARGMSYLHDLGIAHRDLKPGNVVIGVPKPGSSLPFCVKLVDFGMSKTKMEVSKSYTISIPGCGTTTYRAPEIDPKPSRPQGDKPKAQWFKADVFSFALTCSAILSLEPPDRKKRMFGNNLRLELPEDCPNELSALLKECWATDPQRRPNFTDICIKLEKLKNYMCVLSDENYMCLLSDDYLRMMLENRSKRRQLQAKSIATVDDEDEPVEVTRCKLNAGVHAHEWGAKLNSASIHRRRVSSMPILGSPILIQAFGAPSLKNVMTLRPPPLHDNEIVPA